MMKSNKIACYNLFFIVNCFPNQINFIIYSNFHINMLLSIGGTSIENTTRRITMRGHECKESNYSEE